MIDSLTLVVCLAKRGYDDKARIFTLWSYKVLNKIPTLAVVTKMFLLPTRVGKATFCCVECVSVSLISTNINVVGVYFTFAYIEEL